MTVDTVYNIARNLLDTTATALANVGLDVPSRRFVETCSVTAPLDFDGDCAEQLTVHVGSMAMSSMVTQRQSTGHRPLLWDVPFTITWLGCYPIRDAAPTADDQDVTSRDHLRVGWQVARHLIWAAGHGTLTPSYAGIPGIDYVRFGNVACIAPRGGIMGWQFAVTFAVTDAYPDI